MFRIYWVNVFTDSKYIQTIHNNQLAYEIYFFDWPPILFGQNILTLPTCDKDKKIIWPYNTVIW